jgi:hypothetical protein
MYLVEMVFSGEGGLEALVVQVATQVEVIFERHGLVWRAGYPITLREALRLGMQQHLVGAHACPPGPGGSHEYRVWLQLPTGGLRAWTGFLTARLLAGCGKEDVAPGSPLRKDLQRYLVQALGSCLERPELPPAFVGSGV